MLFLIANNYKLIQLSSFYYEEVINIGNYEIFFKTYEFIYPASLSNHTYFFLIHSWSRPTILFYPNNFLFILRPNFYNNVLLVMSCFMLVFCCYILHTSQESTNDFDLFIILPVRSKWCPIKIKISPFPSHKSALVFCWLFFLVLVTYLDDDYYCGCAFMNWILMKMCRELWCRENEVNALYCTEKFCGLGKEMKSI